jgi:hypothetical protein
VALTQEEGRRREEERDELVRFVCVCVCVSRKMEEEEGRRRVEKRDELVRFDCITT